MKILKKLLKARVIVWLATTIVLIVVMIVGNSITNQYSLILDNVLGGKRPIVSDEESGIPFEQDFATKDEAFENGNAVTKEICEEGMVLLKNEGNALPLKANAKVSVFGKNSVNLVYGGSGSAAPGDGERMTIFDSLEEAGFEYNPSLKSFYESSASGAGRSKNPDMDSGGAATLKTGETPISSYSANIISSYDEYGDAAIVVFSRIAGEDWDLPRHADDNADRHYLELDNNERALLKHIVDSGKFEHTIVLMNGSNYIDLGFLKMTDDPGYAEFGSKIDAAIVIGSPGANGIMALGEILSGEINPSGHTVDTVYTNYQNDPTWQNFGDNAKAKGNEYLNQNGSGTSEFYVEYEENIYLGYRYYETRGHLDGEEWYNKNVVYPFGFGLSYTTFEQEITNASSLNSALKANQEFDVHIKVKNTGSKAGKQVVQLYAEAPYTSGGIEKVYKVLVGFGKTKLLNPGASDTVEITVNPYDFASFDNHDKNGNGFKGYELEAGDYIFHAGTDAHTDFATFTKNLADGVKFENDPVTGNKVEVLFDEVTNHMNSAESLSRANFAGTFPKMPTDDERKVTSEFLNLFKNKESTNDEVYNELPTMGADNGVIFKDLVGLDYDDPLWDDFLDQMTFDQMLKLFNEGCYQTAAIEDLDIPQTVSADGPTGLVNFMSATAEASVYGCCYYCSECLVAQTYNVELAAKQANAIGNECLIGDEGTGIAYPGWYAPGVNLHRSPFSGRNTEYYSEDPFMNGVMAATVIKGVQEKGVYANVKHFALNDQETNRGGVATWCDEQAIRELYLKPFEKAVKQGGARGLMTSFNRLGTEWTGGSYRLVTKVLRKEWGFVGTVICDFNTFDKKFMDSKQMLYAGGDINLAGDKKCMLQKSNVYGTPFVTATNAKDANLLRRSAHNNLFALVNSNAMKVDVLGYKPPVWRILLYTGFGVISGALAVWGFFVIFTALRKKDDPAPKAE